MELSDRDYEIIEAAFAVDLVKVAKTAPAPPKPVRPEPLMTLAGKEAVRQEPGELHSLIRGREARLARRKTADIVKRGEPLADGLAAPVTGAADSPDNLGAAKTAIEALSRAREKPAERGALVSEQAPPGRPDILQRLDSGLDMLRKLGQPAPAAKRADARNTKKKETESETPPGTVRLESASDVPPKRAPEKKPEVGSENAAEYDKKAVADPTALIAAARQLLEDKRAAYASVPSEDMGLPVRGLNQQMTDRDAIFREVARWSLGEDDESKAETAGQVGA